MTFDKPLAALRERVGRPDVEKALPFTGLVGGAAFIAPMVGAASISDAVSEADGMNGLDKPVLDLAISVARPRSTCG